MNRFSFHYIIISIGFSSVLICSYLFANSTNCTICLGPLVSAYSVDPWGNAFHTGHEQEGIFCHSCSRIISQGVTNGGYIYSDGRHLCSLCRITAVNDNIAIQTSYQSVISQFEQVGIANIPKNIPINLIDLHTLNQNAGELTHVKLKGFTRIKPENKNQFINSFHIFILFGLPKIEFEAVLAHELLHVWLFQNKVTLSTTSTEGFCNLGRYLIYYNDNTHFSTIHIQAMFASENIIYGKGFREMKVKLEKFGWKKLLSNLQN